MEEWYAAAEVFVVVVVMGRCQIDDAECTLVHAWRGIPTDSCVVAILDNERRAL